MNMDVISFKPFRDATMRPPGEEAKSGRQKKKSPFLEEDGCSLCVSDVYSHGPRLFLLVTSWDIPSSSFNETLPHSTRVVSSLFFRAEKGPNVQTYRQFFRGIFQVVSFIRFRHPLCLCLSHSLSSVAVMFVPIVENGSVKGIAFDLDGKLTPCGEAFTYESHGLHTVVKPISLCYRIRRHRLSESETRAVSASVNDNGSLDIDINHSVKNVTVSPCGSAILGGSVGRSLSFGCSASNVGRVNFGAKRPAGDEPGACFANLSRSREPGKTVFTFGGSITSQRATTSPLFPLHTPQQHEQPNPLPVRLGGSQTVRPEGRPQPRSNIFHMPSTERGAVRFLPMGGRPSSTETRQAPQRLSVTGSGGRGSPYKRNQSKAR